MKDNILNQLGVAVKIWLLSVMINALVGGVVLMSILDSASASFIGALGFFAFLLLFGGIFSLPVLMVITIVLCVMSGNVSGKCLFSFVLAAGVIATTVMFQLFWTELGDPDKKAMFLFPAMGIIAGITGVTTFYRTLLKYGNDFTTVPKYSH